MNKNKKIIQEGSRVLLRPLLLILIALSVLALFPSSGCSNEGRAKRSSYSFMFVDRTGTREPNNSDILCQWGERSFVTILGGSVGTFNDPWPSQAAFIWKDSLGEKHKVVVELPEIESTKWEKVDDIYVCFLPNDKITIEAFIKEKPRQKVRAKIDQFLANGNPAYSIGVQNHTPNDLSKISLRLDNYYVIQESLSISSPANKFNNNGWDLVRGIPYPLSATATIQWTTPDGQNHNRSIAIKDKLPKDINNQTLGFIIEPDNTVKFQVRPTSEWKTWAYEGSPWKAPF